VIAQAGGATRGSLLSRGDHRRDGGEVIRITGMAEAQQHGDPDDDEQGRPVRERGDAVVEPEHG